MVNCGVHVRVWAHNLLAFERKRMHVWTQLYYIDHLSALVILIYS